MDACAAWRSNQGSETEPAQCIVRVAQLDGAGFSQPRLLRGIKLDVERPRLPGAEGGPDGTGPSRSGRYSWPALWRSEARQSNNEVMPSPVAEPSGELAGHEAGQGAPGPVLPDGPRYPRLVQAWLWLKRPTWFLGRCARTYGDVFTMRLPLGINLVHIASPELVKAVFGGDNDVLRAGEGAIAAILEPLFGPHSVGVLDGPEHLRQRKLIMPAFHGDRMRAWEATVREITRAEIARWPVGRPFALRRACNRSP